jgi:hypothetical protein
MFCKKCKAYKAAKFMKFLDIIRNEDWGRKDDGIKNERRGMRTATNNRQKTRADPRNVQRRNRSDMARATQ